MEDVMLWIMLARKLGRWLVASESLIRFVPIRDVLSYEHMLVDFGSCQRDDTWCSGTHGQDVVVFHPAGLVACEQTEKAEHNRCASADDGENCSGTHVLWGVVWL